MSPTRNSRFFRDESNTTTPPPALLRRKTDFRDSSDAKVDERVKDRDSSIDLSTPYGTLKRSVTNPLSASSNGPASPWSTAAPSQSTGFSSMGGAFGNFNIGPITPGGSTDKKTSFGSLRGESRFKNLLSKRSSEDVGGVSKEKSTGLERLPETDNDVSRQLPARSIQTRASRSDTNPFEESRNGNAALGRQDIGTSASGIDQFGLSPFGIPTSTVASSGLMATTQQPASRHEPMSPTNTNPYQSPHRDKVVEPEDIDTDGSDIHPVHLPNLSELQDDPAPASFSSLQRNAPVEGPAGDRNQTSSVGAARGFPSLGGLGGLPSLSSPGGWPVSAAGGTPTRERSAFSSGFGDPIFGSMADLQSPSLSALGAGGFFGSGLGASTPTSNRPSKLGSLFPPAMQDQMRSDQTRQEMTGNESVAKSQGPSSPERGATMTTSAAAQGPLGTAPGQNTTSNQSVLDQSPQATQNVTQTSSTPGQLPTTQQRQMVMPDRMRWIYRDPQGNMQGPWSGLEMHDWFKAGFFTADLQVKKLEDAEYEPLAQLVRRIGNSREPFLVPQIGVPHGAPAQGPWGAPGPNGGVQPPFPSSFPSFGTTLTAEQQNALERRKQEEQYLMARQKEHLAQQQAMMKQMQIQQVAAATTPIHAHPLQHHPSAHSLHSQPSYGSITSPGGFQPPLMQAPIQPPQPQAVPGYLEPPPRQNTMPNLTPQMQPPSAVGGPEELPGLMDRLNVSRSAQFPFGAAENNHHAQQVATMLQDRARLQEEQEQFNRSKQADSIFDMQAREERLRQFHALRGTSDEDVNVRRTDGLPTHPVGLPSTSEQSQDQSQQTADKDQDDQILEKTHQPQQNVEQPLSLSQQVQKAASQRLQEQAQASTRQNESEWKADHGLPQPFPPPPSASPLPAPAAQRNRQNVADALAAGSRSQTHTPVETATTSVAPWAKDISDAPKGPSLKEIQEAEARQAAKLEEAAAAARRALAEQERANQPPPPAPGLPSTANWASATSTTPTPSVGSAWGKAGKGPVGSTPTAPKKTLAQIQKEEEARKQRQQAAAATVATNAQATMPSPAANAGKRYADLAGKVTPQTTISSGGAWTTVGAGGKPKPAPPAPVPQRSVTSTTPVSAAAKPRPVATTTRSATMAMPSTTTTNPNKATEELAKWAKTALGRGLNSSINGKFQQTLDMKIWSTMLMSSQWMISSSSFSFCPLKRRLFRIPSTPTRRLLTDVALLKSTSAVAS